MNISKKDLNKTIRKPYSFTSLEAYSNVFLNNETLFEIKPISKILYNKTYYINDEYNYINELNSSGYRCDEFINTHDNNHILFSGCSQTWGSGLLIDEVWSKRVYDKICKYEKCSGYFNLGLPGTSLFNQIADIFKYCITYGVPKCIFLNFPGIQRMYAYDKERNEYYDAFYSSDSFYVFEILQFQYYLMLYEYCKKNNILLFTFSWSILDKTESDSFSKNIQKFDSFYKMNAFNIENYVLQYKKENPQDDYSVLARDNAHAGNAYQSYWADFIYNKYQQKTFMV